MTRKSSPLKELWALIEQNALVSLKPLLSVLLHAIIGLLFVKAYVLIHQLLAP